MKSEAHLNFVVGDFLDKPIIISVLKDFGAFVYLNKNFDEGVNREIGQNTQILLVMPSNLIVFVFNTVITFRNFPHK
jgi:hypothetical protein